MLFFQRVAGRWLSSYYDRCPQFLVAGVGTHERVNCDVEKARETFGMARDEHAGGDEGEQDVERIIGENGSSRVGCKGYVPGGGGWTTRPT